MSTLASLSAPTLRQVRLHEPVVNMWSHVLTHAPTPAAINGIVDIKWAICCRERLGGLPSSGLGIKTLRGGFETLSPQDFLNVPELDPHMTADFHAIVDRQQGTKPL